MRKELSKAIQSKFVPQSLMGATYMPFQVAGLEWMLSNPSNSMLIADEMGLGKSLQAIGFANERRICKILVICPSVVVTNWENEFRKFHLKRDLKIQRIKHGRDEWKKDTDVFIVSYNLFDPSKLSSPRSLLVCDESHYLKTGKSLRTKLILNKNTLAKFKYHLFLSGTPMLNRPMELYPLLKAISHSTIGFCDKHTYGLRFCGARRDVFGRWDYTGASNLEALNELLRNSVMLRRKKEDVLSQLPEKRLNIVQFEMDAVVEDLDAKIQPYKEEILKGVQHGAGLDGVTTHRRLVSEKKAPLVVEYCKMLLDSTSQIVIFAHHREVIKFIDSSLKDFGISKVVGGLNADQKGEEVKKFVSRTNRVFLGNIQAAGVGITLTNANVIVMAEASWVPGENDQAIDRCHRIGQKNSIDVHFLVYRRSIDEYILKANFKKQKVINETMK